MRTPLNDYPERGRRELEAFMVRRSVLANLLRSRCRALSIVGTDCNQVPALDVPPANENRRLIERPAHLRGRPRNTAWPRNVELAREHPDRQKKRLAFEAWSRTRHEFSDSQLPSLATIQRSMVGILGRGHQKACSSTMTL